MQTPFQMWLQAMKTTNTWQTPTSTPSTRTWEDMWQAGSTYWQNQQASWARQTQTAQTIWEETTSALRTASTCGNWQQAMTTMASLQKSTAGHLMELGMDSLRARQNLLQQWMTLASRNSTTGTSWMPTMPTSSSSTSMPWSSFTMPWMQQTSSNGSTTSTSPSSTTPTKSTSTTENTSETSTNTPTSSASSKSTTTSPSTEKTSETTAKATTSTSTNSTSGHSKSTSSEDPFAPALAAVKEELGRVKTLQDSLPLTSSITSASSTEPQVSSTKESFARPHKAAMHMVHTQTRQSLLARRSSGSKRPR